MTCCDSCGNYIPTDNIRFVDFEAPGELAAELCPECYEDLRRKAFWYSEFSKERLSKGARDD